MERSAHPLSLLGGAVSVALLLAGCASEDPSGFGDTEPPKSSSPAEPGSGADGGCGDGEVETQEVLAAQGVGLTVPADWRVKRARAGEAIGLYPPDRAVGDGFVLVEEKGQTLDEAVDDVLGVTAESAEQTSEQELDLEGFDRARLVTFAYDDSDAAYSVDVVAVSGGLRVAANMTRDGDPTEQALVESCLSTLARTLQ